MESNQIDPKPNTCDWSHAATDTAAQAKAALKAFSINGKPNGAALQQEFKERRLSLDENSMSPPSGPTEAAMRYLSSNDRKDDDEHHADIPIRRVHSDINTSKRSLVQGDSNTVVRPSQSMDQAFRTKKKLDKYGFIINMDDQGNLFDDDVSCSERIPTFAETKRTERREQKWNGMLSSWERKKTSRKKLLKRLRKGVPDSLRGRVWCRLANVPYKIQVEKRGYYDQLVISSTRHASFSEEENSLQEEKHNLEEPPSATPKSFRATQDTIERDIHRTFPRHNLFHQDSGDDDDSDDDVLQGLCDAEVSSWIAQLENHEEHAKQNSGTTSHQDAPTPINAALARGGQASLRRILRAYSLHDTEVGYCQGMNFIAATFLTFMSEEEAFWLLVGNVCCKEFRDLFSWFQSRLTLIFFPLSEAAMNDPPGNMRGMFGRDMQEAHKILYVADKLIQQFLPRLARHLEKEHIHITMYATQWFLTLYTSSFQFDLVTRVWDCFLAEGWKVVYRVMLALMTNSQPVLMTLSFEEILAHFRDLPDQVSGDKIMDIALKINLKRKHIVKYEKEWIANNRQ